MRRVDANLREKSKRLTFQSANLCRLVQAFGIAGEGVQHNEEG